MHEGEKLSQIIRIKGLTREEFGEMMGVNRQTIQNWIRLDSLPPGRLLDIERVLNVKFYKDQSLEEMLSEQKEEILNPEVLSEIESLKSEITIMKADLYDIKKKLGL